MISDAVSNAAYRVPRRGPGAELERVLKNPFLHQVVENILAQQGGG